MPYWQLYYHIVTATKNRQPIITPEIEPLLFNAIRHKAGQLQGRIFALNGIEDHLHLIVSIPPVISLASFIGQIKGFSSSELVHRSGREKTFAWQDSYGAFTIDRKHLPVCIAYVEKQKEHHRLGTAHPVFEQTEDHSTVVREEADIYSAVDLPY